MKFKTIKNCGRLGTEFNIIGDGTKVSRDFLNRLISNIVIRSTNYFDETKDHIFSYREKQLHSVVCPSIADITNSYVMEHPLTRKPYGEEEYPGRVDYWISYRKYSFLMELKHSYFAYNRMNGTNLRIYGKFNEALTQLKDIKKKECRDLSIDKGLIKIALETIVFYRSSKNNISANAVKCRDFEKDLKILIQKANLTESNLRSLWLLHERLIEPVGNFIYPAVAFIGKISEVVE